MDHDRRADPGHHPAEVFGGVSARLHLADAGRPSSRDVPAGLRRPVAAEHRDRLRVRGRHDEAQAGGPSSFYRSGRYLSLLTLLPAFGIWGAVWAYILGNAISFAISVFLFERMKE